MKKKFLPLAFAVLGASALLLTTNLKTVSNFSNEPSIVLADGQLDDYKAQKKDEINGYVDIDSFADEQLKQELIEFIDYILGEIDEATTPQEVDALFIYATQRIDALVAEYTDPQAKELEHYKQSKIDYINEHFDLESYPESKQEYYRHLYDDCISNIMYADTTGVVDYFFYAFLRDINIDVPDVPEAETLEQAKEYAYEEIDRTIDGYSLYDYFEQDLKYLMSKTKEAIDAATTIDEVKEVMDNFRSEFNKFPKNEDVSINKFRRELIDAYIAYEFERIQASGFNDVDDVLPEMDEKFEKDMKAARTVEDLLSCYQYAIEGLNELMPLQIHGGTVDPQNNNSKSNTGLIVACAVEGAVIVAGLGVFLVNFLKKKKQLGSK